MPPENGGIVPLNDLSCGTPARRKSLQGVVDQRRALSFHAYLGLPAHIGAAICL
jgi:hypothetical protein